MPLRAVLASLALLLAFTGRASAEDVPAPQAPQAPLPSHAEALPDLEAIAARLLSPLAAEQAEGERQLARLLRTTRDVDGLIARLGAALRARLAAPPPAPAPAPSAPPDVARIAPPIPTAPDGAFPREPVPPEPVPVAPPVDRLAEPPAPPAPPPPPAPTQAKSEASAPSNATPRQDVPRRDVPSHDVKVWAVSVAAREVAALLPDGREAPGQVDAMRGDDGAHAIVGPAEWAAAWAQKALRSADATPLAERTLTLPDPPAGEVHLGRELGYRRDAADVGKGAWAVQTDVVRQGLSLSWGADDRGTVLDVAWVEVAQPMATERIRPAPDVEPIELDRPDWSRARRRVEVRFVPQGRAHLFVLPGLLPDPERRLVLVLAVTPR